MNKTGSSSTSVTNPSAMESGGGNQEYAEIDEYDRKQPELNSTAGKQLLTLLVLILRILKRQRHLRIATW